jgi:hypothetical protein
MIKDDYSKLKGLGLPDFDRLNKEFGVSDIEETDFLLRTIRELMAEKVDSFVKILESVIQPETNAVCMFECKVFDDKEKLEVFDVFKKLMSFVRLSSEVALDCDDKKDAEFITNLFGEWLKLKPLLKEKISKLRVSWQKDVDLKEEFGYFG